MTFNLIAAAAENDIANKFGFWYAMEQGGPVAWFILAVLVIMSVGTFYILITKLLEQRKVMNEYKEVRSTFWRANSIEEGARKLDENSAWRQLADDAVAAKRDHGKMTDEVEAHDWLHGTMIRSQDSIMNRLSTGLPFLASTGATAPFIGLLGTVIGIYRALINIGIAGSASIDKVAGPVGEALIMTAIGLFVAVPAVLCYNWLQSRNKRIQAMLTTFSTELMANITSNGNVKPVQGTTATTAKTATATTAAKTAPVTARPATAGTAPASGSTTAGQAGGATAGMTTNTTPKR